ncbi:MAG TPA: histidine phosphatase family protein, partial [Ktedonobacterales bacterium]|nr:histidine phosphatase family protein [Ktedonobacterales bacterium]
WDSIPGSEPSAHLRARLTAAIDSLARRHPGERIAVVSHAGAINAYIAAMLGLANDYFFPAANTSISIVRIKGARFMLLALNDVNHLREAGLLKVME